MIDAPQKSIETLESINNRISMAESEERRLRNLKISLSQEIDELVKSKKWHEEEIERLGNELKTVKTELADKQTILAEARSVIEKADEVSAGQKSEWDKLNQAKSAHMEVMSQAKTELDAERNRLNEEHSERLQTLIHRETAVKRSEISIAEKRRGLIELAEFLTKE